MGAALAPAVCALSPCRVPTCGNASMPAASGAAGTSPGPGSPVELGGQDKAMSWNEGLKIAAFFSVVFGIVFGVHSVLPPMP